MLAVERKQRIKEIILAENKVYVNKLSVLFNVTEETIRRDLEKLEKEGIITKTYGGAILNSETTRVDPPFIKRVNNNLSAKRTIAEKAITLVQEGYTIMADSSSTSLETLKLCSNFNNLKVLTNSLSILNELGNTSVNLISTGGVYNYASMSLIGSIPEDILKKYNVDIAFISCKGIDLEKGITDANEAESELKRIMTSQALKTCLLIDSSKFNKIAFIKLFEFNKIDYIITETEPSVEWLNFFDKNNIELIY